MNLSALKTLANDVLPAYEIPARSIGDILALITAGASWSPSAMVAARLAARFGTSLTGAYFDPELVTAVMGNGGMSSFVQPLGSVIGHVMDAPNERDFAAFARRHHVTDTHWTILRTQMAQRLQWLSSWHDLAVLESDMASIEKVHGILRNVLVTCRQPCVLLPPDYHDEARFERIAIGWNNSISATRAIHAARPLLMQARQVYLLDGAPRDTGRHDDFAHFDPYQYLAQDGITVVPVDVAEDASGESLLDVARHAGSDLLVLGAYNQSPIRERMLSGVTRHAIEHADLPLFLRH